MSWANVKKINSNFNKPLNEQARELSYSGAYILTSSGDFKPDKSGWYKVIVVGAGGECDRGSDRAASGGSGGVAIKTMHLSHLNLYAYKVTRKQSTFNGDIIATAGGDGSVSSDKHGGYAGTASGGDLNYSGSAGTYDSNGIGLAYAPAESVGVYIPELMRATYCTDNIAVLAQGYGVLGYGASGRVDNDTTQYSSQPGAVIIIPLEFEE